MTPYASDELVLIVPRHHELAKKSSIELGELQNLPLVSLNQVHSHSVMRHLKSAHAHHAIESHLLFYGVQLVRSACKGFLWHEGKRFIPQQPDHWYGGTALPICTLQTPL